MSPLIDLRIDAAISGKEDAFAEALAAKEQHWSGPGGAGGDVRPSSRLTLDEVLEARLDLSAYDEADLRYAARRLRAAFPDDADIKTLAAHVEAWELHQSEQFEKEMARDMNTNAMESFLRERGVPMVEQRTPISNRDLKRQHPAQRAPLMYPTGVTPTAEDADAIDPDRAARGARSASFSQRLRSLAQEVQQMARLSSSPRQRNRLLARAAELERMSVRQFEREGTSEAVLSDDPSEPNNVLNRFARDMDDEARAPGAQGDDFTSLDDWSDRPTADDQLTADVRDQVLDEDLPRLPRPGRRYGGRESIRESSDLTAQLIEDQKLHWYGSHGSW